MINQSSKVIVVGCGGIGSWLIPPLCRFLSASKWKGQLHLIDGDHYEDKNKDRQDFEDDHLGLNKAEGQLNKLAPQFPSMDLMAHPEYVSDDNVDALIVNDSIVFVGVDNHPARARIDRRASKLDTVCVFSAGNELTEGNVSISLRRSGVKLTESLLERHPETGTTKERDRAAGCEDLIEEGNVQLLTTNSMAAQACMNGLHLLWDPPDVKGRSQPPIPQEIYFDINQGAMATVWVPEPK